MDGFLPEFRKLAGLIRTDTEALRQGGELVYPSRGKPGPVARLDQISLTQYLQEKQRQGVSADFTRLIEVMYLGMYGLECEEQSVYNLLMLIDIDSDALAIYGDSDESKRVRGGNSRLVEALDQAVRKKTPIELGHKLVRIKDDGNAFTLDFATGGASKGVRAEALICTLPFTTLRDVEGVDRLGLSPAKAEAIKSLGYATNSKLTVGFKEAFWTNGSKLLPPNYGTVFSDRLTKEVRASSNNQKGKSGIILNYLSGKQGKFASPNLVGETLEHLELLYPGSRQLADGNKNLQHWPSDPFVKASYVCFRPGHFTAMGGYDEPGELGGRMVFAGEHMSSDWGGYMEGALGTGKAAADAISQQSGMELTPSTPMRRRARRA
jgi:monoamine oxidase